MRTTITLDDDFLARASMLTGMTNRMLLIRESFKAIIARESVRRRALLGGSMPDFELTPRRRPEPEHEHEHELESTANPLIEPSKKSAGETDQLKA